MSLPSINLSKEGNIFEAKIFNLGVLPVYLFNIYLTSILTLVFGFYPIKFKSNKSKGFANLIIESRYIKRILYVEILILIFAALMVISIALELHYDIFITLIL